MTVADRITLQTWPDNWRAEFEERAAIMEFEGNLGRDDAEMLAMTAVRIQRGHYTPATFEWHDR